MPLMVLRWKVWEGKQPSLERAVEQGSCPRSGFRWGSGGSYRGPVQSSNGRMAWHWARAELGGTWRKWESTGPQVDLGLREAMSLVGWSMHSTICKLYQFIKKWNKISWGQFFKLHRKVSATSPQMKRFVLYTHFCKGIKYEEDKITLKMRINGQ